MLVLHPCGAGSMDISSHTVAGLHKEALKKGIVLLIMVVVGRWAQTLAAAISPYARKGGGASAVSPSVNSGAEPAEASAESATPVTGTAAGLVAHTRLIHCLVASVLPLFLLGTLYGTRGMMIFAAVCTVILLLTLYTRSRIGGATGDTIGMTNEVSELVFLFLFFVI